MANEVGYKGHFVVLLPVNPSAVPNGALFIDSTNGNASSIKGTTGVVAPIGSTDSSMFIKQMQIASPISANAPISKRPDGRIEAADSNAPTGQNYVGQALVAGVNVGDLINVLCVGANMANAILGLGFAPGDEVFINENGGYTNDISTFTGGNDSIIRVGIADCAAGVASTTATDLIMLPQIVARP